MAIVLVYNDKNQIVEKNIAANIESTKYIHEDGQIIKAESSKDSSLVYTHDYTYNDDGFLISDERTNHSESAVDGLTTYEYDANGNVIKENVGTSQTNIFTGTYDAGNNPFKGIYPSAYAAINSGIEAVSTNNPVSGTLADNGVAYEYNTDDYPVSASYTYFDGLSTVDKTDTYYTE